MSDYPVVQVEGVVESQDFAATGLPRGVRQVTFTSTKDPFAKVGIFKLIQLAILVLLRTPGRDIISPETGGGLKLILGKNVGPSLITQRRGEISIAVSATEDQLISAQSDTDLPPEERLLSLTLLDATFDFTTLEWNVVLRLISEAGGAAEVLL